MSIVYIWSQVFTVIEYALLGWSYFAKNRKLVVILDIFSMISGIIALILLDAGLGIALSIIILLANFYYLWDENVRKRRDLKKYFLRDYIAITVILVSIGIVTIFTNDGPFSLLSTIATTLYEISIWQKVPKLTNFSAFLSPFAGQLITSSSAQFSAFSVKLAFSSLQSGAILKKPELASDVKQRTQPLKVIQSKKNKKLKRFFD